jgi:hypothetical protein
MPFAFGPAVCPACDHAADGYEPVISEPGEPAEIAPGVFDYGESTLTALAVQPCGCELDMEGWMFYFQVAPPVNGFRPVHRCGESEDAHEHRDGFYVCPGSDVPHPLADAAVSLGWWAVEDPEHEHKWRPVPEGTDGAAPDANRVARERPNWVGSLPAEYQPLM